VSDALCRSADVPEGEARGVDGPAAGRAGLVLVRRAGRLHAFVNACPHLGTPLNFLPDRFLDRERRHLLCATHGAIFRIEDGLCLRGPCRGARLSAARVAESGGLVRLADPDAP